MLSTLEPEALSTLIGLLASTDVLHEPTRGPWDGRRVSALWVRGDEYRRAGVAIRERGDTDGAERMRRVRLWDSLEAAGLVRFARTKGRRSHAKLTDGADWALRALCQAIYPQHFVNLLNLLDWVDDGRPEAYRDVDLVCLPGWDGGDPDVQWRVQRLQEIAAPGLCRGFISTFSDVYGGVGYRLLAKGRKWLEGADVAELVAESRVTFSREACDEYQRYLDDLRLESATWPAGRSIAVPFSAGGWRGLDSSVPRLFNEAGEFRDLEEFLGALRNKLGERAALLG